MSTKILVERGGRDGKPFLVISHSFTPKGGEKEIVKITKIFDEVEIESFLSRVSMVKELWQEAQRDYGTFLHTRDLAREVNRDRNSGHKYMMRRGKTARDRANKKLQEKVEKAPEVVRKGGKNG